MASIQKRAIAVFSAVAGIGLVVAGFKYSALNWIVDGPGSIVSRFFSVDFHEGDVFGVVLSLFLSWLCASLFIFVAVYWFVKIVGRLGSDAHTAP
jgi:hypothetical protein